MTLDTAASHPTTSAADRCPLPYTSPTHLQAVAYLHGIVAADPDRARVLELGCMSGANLLPFATAYPQAQAIGIDLDEEKNCARADVGSAIWINQSATCAMDLASLLDSNLGKFDYIIVHGVFGLVSGEARSALLAYCHRHLSAKGVVCFPIRPIWCEDRGNSAGCFKSARESGRNTGTTASQRKSHVELFIAGHVCK